MCSFNFHSSQRQQLKEPVDAKCIIFLQTDTSAHFSCLVFTGSYFVLCAISSSPSIHQRCFAQLCFAKIKRLNQRIQVRLTPAPFIYANTCWNSEDEEAVEGADTSHTAPRLFLALTVASLYVAAPTLTVIDPSLDASEWNT